MSSPFFEQEKLIIEGNKNLSYETICNTIAFKPKSNIFLFNFLGSKKKLLKNSFVEKVDLKYIFPNKIILVVKEREPKCYIKYLNDAYILVDNKLRVLEISKSKEKKVPVFIGLDFNSFYLGEKLTLKNKYNLDYVIALANNIIKNDFDLYDLVVDLKNENDIHVHIKNIDILLGDIDNCNYKIALLKSILDSGNEYLEKPGILNLKEKNQTPIFKFIT